MGKDTRILVFNRARRKRRNYITDEIVLTKGLNKGIESREIDESTARKELAKSTLEKLIINTFSKENNTFVAFFKKRRQRANVQVLTLSATAVKLVQCHPLTDTKKSL